MSNPDDKGSEDDDDAAAFGAEAEVDVTEGPAVDGGGAGGTGGLCCAEVPEEAAGAVGFAPAVGGRDAFVIAA